MGTSANKGRSVEEILQQSDIELTGSGWAKLASLIMAYEGTEWHEARTKAIDLLKDGRGQALDYIKEVRENFGYPNELKEKNIPTKKEKPKKAKKKSGQDRFSKNYRKLMKVAPELEELLLSNPDELYGKSKVTGYMDFSIDYITRDRKGYYIALSHYFEQNGDLVPDPTMEIFVDVKNQVIEALTFQDQFRYLPVYQDIYKRDTVNTREKRSQNAFLETWLNNLINQGHHVEFEEDGDDFVPVKGAKKTETVSEPKTGQKEPDLSFADESVIAEIREHANNTMLDEIVRLVLDEGKKDKSNLRPVAQYFYIRRINESPLGAALPYPTQKEIEQDYKELVEQYKQKKQTDKSVEKLSSPDESEIEDTVKYWTKLASVIEDVEGLSREKAKEKALELKKSGKAEEYVLTAFGRKSTAGTNQLFKLNYQMLLRLIPDLSEGKVSEISGIIKRKKEVDPLLLEYEGMEDVSKTVYALSIAETGKDKNGILIIAINRRSKKTWVLVSAEKFDILTDYNHENASESESHKVNKEFGAWLKIKLHYKFKGVANDPVEQKEHQEDDWDNDVNNKIPDFEPGKVKLVEAHEKVGLDQKDIDWINKNKRGMTLTPVKNMNNKTKSFEADMEIQAMKPGFRISKTGKLYRENRSNRSDLTDQGI